jgi:DNA anti-recombination protein RmuC
VSNGPVPGPGLIAQIADALSGVWSIISIVVALIALVTWVVRQEGRIIALEKDIEANTQRLDDFNLRGTRAMSERVAELNQLGVTLNAHMNALDARENQRDQADELLLADFEKRLRAIEGRFFIEGSELEKRLRALEDLRRQIDVLVTKQDEGYRKFNVLEQRIDNFSREFNRAMERIPPLQQKN